MTPESDRLSPREFESYVAELVAAMEFASKGSVFQNKRYPGVRQAGTYEVDVALEVQLDEAVDFRLIVECKNWRRPVGRPVVQQVAQTRDGVGANKAAIASPVGFTREAKAVARTLDVALWVVTLDDWHIEYAAGHVVSRTRRTLYDGCTEGGIPARIVVVDWGCVDWRDVFVREALPQHMKWAWLPKTVSPPSCAVLGMLLPVFAERLRPLINRPIDASKYVAE